MLTVEDILSNHRRARKRPSEEELRKLPDRRALVYARPSSPHQVQESRESMREIGALVDLARADGYQTDIQRAEIDAWVEDIRTGAAEPGIRDGGGLLVVTLDLGISGTLGHQQRRGLALVKELLERQELGAVYLPEVSRLSRDQHFIEPFVLLRLMKDSACKVRTPDGVLSPQIPRDWETLKDEFDDARQELKVLGRRLHRKRRQRAERGEWSGEPVAAGFILPVVERRPDGRYIFGKYEPYLPHAQMAAACLEALVKHRSFVEAARALRGCYFPLFPPGLEYMERRSGLHYCVKTPAGYRITPNVIRTLATDPRMIGVWTWGDTDPIPGNHPSAVPEELWLEAHEIATSTGKPRGPAARSETLDWAGLLYCGHHAGDCRLIAYGSRKRYCCVRDRENGQGDLCLDITARFLDLPLGREVLRQLRLDDYADEVLARLEEEASAGKLEEGQHKQEEARLARELQGLRELLGSVAAVNPQQARICLDQIAATEEKLAGLRGKQAPPRSVKLHDVEWVRRFLRELPQRWEDCPGSDRNRLLKVLVEKVLVRRDGRSLDAAILWRAGHREHLRIGLPPAKHTKDGEWTDEELRLLRLLWPGSSREAILAALPGRTWRGVSGQAFRMKMRRKVMRQAPLIAWRPWTPEEEDTLRAMYEKGTPVEAIASVLGRSMDGIEVMASRLKLVRPKPRQTEVYWQIVHNSNDFNADGLGSRTRYSGSWNVWSLRHHGVECINLLDSMVRFGNQSDANSGYLVTPGTRVQR